MYIIYKKKLLETERWIQESIYHLLEESDKEFIPPLSSRYSTIQQNFQVQEDIEGNIREYFETINSQQILIAIDGNDVIGFMSFRSNYICDVIQENYIPNIYVSTVVVDKKYRNMGITSKFYKRLINRYKDRNIFTRTWSKNIIHIRILKKSGFKIIYTKKDDRGVGIDTLYFGKLMNN